MFEKQQNNDDKGSTISISELKEINPSVDNKKFIATIDSIKDLALKIIDENPSIPSEASFAIKNIHSKLLSIFNVAYAILACTPTIIAPTV